MNKSPAFQFYPADYLADSAVDMMTLEQQGAYWRLVCHAWRSTTVGRLLNDRQQLSSLARMTVEQWDANKDAILRAFRIDADGYITQKRLVEESEKQQLRRNQAVTAGKASAASRSTTVQRPLNTSSTNGQQNANPSSSSSSSSSTALKDTKACDPRFLEFWQAYPRKIDRKKAATAFARAIKQTSLEAMLGAIDRQKDTEQWKSGERFIPHPTTWLNGERWTVTESPAYQDPNFAPVKGNVVPPRFKELTDAFNRQHGLDPSLL